MIGVEPAAGDDATQSFKKRLVTIAVPDTIADGARTPSLGEITFPLVMRYVDDMLTVTDDELRAPMFYLWERMKIVVEPTGALAYAALHTRKLQPSGRVGVVLSGGNVDLRWAAKQRKSQNHARHHRGGELQFEPRHDERDRAARKNGAQRPIRGRLKPSMPCSAKRRTPCTPWQRCNRARCRRACRALSIPG